MKTFSAKPAEVKHEWFVIDATDKVLGRVASEVALRLRGKHKAIYTPHVDTGDFIIIVNADKIRVTGSKFEDKVYYRHSGHPGGIHATTFREMQARHPGLPAVPTTAEAGLAGFELEAWVAVFAPAGTPADVIQKLTAGLKQSLEQPETKTRATAAGIELRYAPYVPNKAEFLILTNRKILVDQMEFLRQHVSTASRAYDLVAE